MYNSFSYVLVANSMLKASLALHGVMETLLLLKPPWLVLLPVLKIILSIYQSILLAAHN